MKIRAQQIMISMNNVSYLPKEADDISRYMTSDKFHGIIAEVAKTTANLGIDRVDISGAIQFVSELSGAHQALFADVLVRAKAIADGTRLIAEHLGRSESSASGIRDALKTSTSALGKTIENMSLLTSVNTSMSGEIGTFSSTLGTLDTLAGEIAHISRQTNLLA